MQSQAVAAFSTSRLRMAKEGETDDELVAKLESELQTETEMRDPNEVPISVKDFLENSPFKLIDNPGEEEVVLTRKFGNETIKISFSIADLHAMDPDADPYQDPAMADEEDADSLHANEGNPKDFKVAPEDELEGEGEGEEGAEDGETDYPVRVNVIITKPKSGALNFETVAHQGQLMVENVYYYKDATLAEGKTAEKAHERQSLYAGPPFHNLDEELGQLLERYLDERGVNTALALFVPDYVEMKEQKEYLRWLENVQSFVEA